MRVLFLCPHGAAKSVIASAILNDLARRGHLEITSSSAGTEPDDEISSIAVDALLAHQLPVPDGPPQLVTRQLIERADVVARMSTNSLHDPDDGSTGPTHRLHPKTSTPCANC